MRLFKRHTQIAYLALLALAMQLCASFAHVHPVRVALAAFASADTKLTCRTFFQPSEDHSCPPLRRDEHQCSICWTITLAGSSVLPEAPALPLPSLADGSQVLGVSRVLDPGIRTHAFEARAPPRLV